MELKVTPQQLKGWLLRLSGPRSWLPSRASCRETLRRLAHRSQRGKTAPTMNSSRRRRLKDRFGTYAAERNLGCCASQPALLRRDQARGRQSLDAQREFQLRLRHEAPFQHDIADTASAQMRLHRNFRCGMVSDDRVQRGDNADGVFNLLPKQVAIDRDARHAVIFQRLAGGRQLRQAAVDRVEKVLMTLDRK